MLNGVYFYNATDGYAVGDDGDVYFSNDAGSSWTLQTIPANNLYDLNAVFFKNPYFGLAVGSDGKLLWYVDNNALVAEGTTSSPVTVINANSVSILGVVDDKGLAAALEFEYGTSISFGSSIPMYPFTTSAQGPEDTQVTLTGLTADQVYFGRMKMTNATGVSYSNIVSFFTGVTTIPNFNFELWDAYSTDVLDEWMLSGGVNPITSYNGSFAAELTANSNDDTGAILYGEPGPMGFAGGVPFTARPDSLFFWTKYDIAIDDSAIVVLQFKSGGAVISDTIYKITGTSSGIFVEKKFKIEYSSGIFPDTVILAFANTNVLSGITDPTSVLSVDDVSFYGTTQNVPNADMEDWSIETRNKAVSWVSNDDFWNNGSTYMAEKSSDAYSGDFAVKLSNTVGGNNNQFARLRVGDDLNNWNPVFPVDFNHEHFYGYVKYAPDNGDTLFVRVTMYENGVQNGWGELKMKDPISTFTLFDLPISYSSGTSDSCLVEFSIYKNNGGQPGNSFALIDNLSFDAILLPTQNVGIEEILPNTVSIYPNPTDGPLTIEFARLPESEISVMVVDLAGNVILSENVLPTSNQLNININNLPSQYCFVIIREGKFSHSFKTLVK
jgi:hypothetical protein